MGHLTYTRKCYNLDEAPEGLDGVGACERMSRDVTLPSCSSGRQLCPFAIILYSLPRGPCHLKPIFIPCNSFLNVAAQCKARGMYRLVIAVR